MLNISPKKEIAKIIEWMQKTFAKTKQNKVVVGLSGGLDSAIVAYLAERAFGPKNVICVKLPYKTSCGSSIIDADKVIKLLGVESKEVDITYMADSFVDKDDYIDPTRFGNILARIRMIILFDIAAQNSGIVLGTSNKSELLLGYGTMHGDLASIMNPIAKFYKSQIRILAEHLDVPSEIIEKAPSADLFAGQTDEKDLGFTYKQADEIMYSIFDEKNSKIKTTNLGYDMDDINEVLLRVESNKFKGEVPYKYNSK
ncbi:MAG: NAD+ synthase [Candidatus Delongbacteria bacterium]|jgi:NAD+ synthase|nr:NAD+ synthase [Candidatus Delongbacteria bacterium]